MFKGMVIKGKFKYLKKELWLNSLSFIERKVIEMFQTLKLAKKTSKDDYTTHLRLVLLGMGAVGGIAFVIKLIAEFITFTGPRQ